MISRKAKSNYSEMSNKVCPDCGRPIKKNVTDRVNGTCRCYICFKLSKGKKTVNVHKLVDGKKVFVKTVDFLELQKQNKRKYAKV